MENSQIMEKLNLQELLKQEKNQEKNKKKKSNNRKHEQLHALSIIILGCIII